ncbi:hypothetical protein MNBD_GAMMA14-2487 [hydrothermal vent metagenome]|uniref:Uncharacterized protein n=1 Tax=hydrothermal vent metagenome TaxID=652676 RepID=A0A3B0YRB2_9ZZZZ
MAGFSRYHKYTLGTELRNKSREVVALIIVRIAKETRAFKSFKSFQYAIERVVRPYPVV